MEQTIVVILGSLSTETCEKLWHSKLKEQSIFFIPSLHFIIKHTIKIVFKRRSGVETTAILDINLFMKSTFTNLSFFFLFSSKSKSNVPTISSSSLFNPCSRHWWLGRVSAYSQCCLKLVDPICFKWATLRCNCSLCSFTFTFQFTRTCSFSSYIFCTYNDTCRISALIFQLCLLYMQWHLPH